MNLLDPQVEIIKEEDTLREELAALEHEQWMAWAKDVSEEQNVSARKEKWKKLFIPYEELSEEDKDKDREWADKVLEIISEYKSMDGSSGKGAEWIPTKMLKPKKKGKAKIFIDKEVI